MTSEVLAGWEKSSHTAAGFTRETFRRGSGPGIIVVHEVPGITPKVSAFANELVDSGFTVVMPSLVGLPGKDISGRYAASSIAKVCISREFAALATNRTSPIIAWLRSLGRQLHEELGGAGIGALGMCFSGGFALGMMVDDHVTAPVLSQPSMPFAIGKKRAANLHLSPNDERLVAERAANGCEILGLRYTDDRHVGDRFATLRALIGDKFIGVELPSTKKSDHSVLTEQRDDESVQRVIKFFHDKLE